MLTLRKIAVTGNPSAGKSTVCQLLKKLGAYVLDSDEIVHFFLSHDQALKKDAVRLLGKEILAEDKINRDKVAKIVFNSREKLKKLEQLIHPRVLNKINEEYQTIKNQNKYRLFVVEMPLLFEIKQEKLFDTVVAVIANGEALAKRKKASEHIKRNQRQMAASKKAAKADFVIDNSQDLKNLEKQVFKLYSQLTNEEDA